MLARIAILLGLFCCFILVGCPENKKEMVDQVGGAPKRQLDNVQQNLDKAAQDSAERLKHTGEVEQ